MDNKQCTEEKIKLMAEFKAKVIEYLTNQNKINTDALKTYEEPIKDSDPEIRRMREIEAIKLRHAIYDNNTHIAVIQKM